MNERTIERYGDRAAEESNAKGIKQNYILCVSFNELIYFSLHWVYWWLKSTKQNMTAHFGYTDNKVKRNNNSDIYVWRVEMFFFFSVSI